jgi:3-oxoacyl-[acyl-carrier-protein] synthase-3
MKLIKPNINIKVKATSTYIPEEFEYSNLDILDIHSSTRILPKFAKKKLASSIEKKFGFEKRYMIRKPGDDSQSIDKLSCEEMSSLCLKKCFNNSSEDIGYFIMGTTTSSRYTGSQATSVLSTIGQYSPAVEMMAGCSTSLASLYTGIMALQSGHDNVMIVCSETMSKIVNPKIRETWFGLADGSASLWLESNDIDPDFKVLGMIFGTNGEHVDMYTTQGKFPPNQKDLDSGGYVLAGDGDKLRELSLKYYGEMIEHFKESFNLDEIDYLIPHQVNNSIITEFVDTHFKGIDIRVLKNNKEIGNIGGTSVLFSLCDSIQKDTFKKGDKVLMMSVGGGLSFSMQLWEKL